MRALERVERLEQGPGDELAQALAARVQLLLFLEDADLERLEHRAGIVLRRVGGGVRQDGGRGRQRDHAGTTPGNVPECVIVMTRLTSRAGGLVLTCTHWPNS